MSPELGWCKVAENGGHQPHGIDSLKSLSVQLCDSPVQIDYRAVNAWSISRRRRPIDTRFTVQRPMRALRPMQPAKDPSCIAAIVATVKAKVIRGEIRLRWSDAVLQQLLPLSTWLLDGSIRGASRKFPSVRHHVWNCSAAHRLVLWRSCLNGVRIQTSPERLVLKY